MEEIETWVDWKDERQQPQKRETRHFLADNILALIRFLLREMGSSGAIVCRASHNTIAFTFALLLVLGSVKKLFWLISRGCVYH